MAGAGRNMWVGLNDTINNLSAFHRISAYLYQKTHRQTRFKFLNVNFRFNRICWKCELSECSLQTTSTYKIMHQASKETHRVTTTAQIQKM
jgi:hypothetical protein